MSIDGISNPHTPTASSNGSTIAGQRNQAPSHSNDHGTTSTPTSSPSTTTLTSLPDQSEPNNTLSNSTKPMASTASSDNNQVSIITNTRTRRERPCDGCRRRKSRCVLNEDGVCVLCRFHKQDCTFVQSPQPRKRRIPADASNGSDNKRDRDREKRNIDRDASSSNNSSNSSNSSTRRSRNPTAAPARTTLGLQHRRFSRYIGASAEFDEALIDLCTLNVSDEFPLPAHLVGSSFRRVYKDTTFLMRPEKVDTELRDVDAVESLVSPHGQQLLNLYFRVVHPSFPILHKKLFLEKYQRTHREFAPCLLAAVYIIALNWWKHDPDLSQHSQPDLHKLEEIANRCMNDVISHPKLSTIQAGLLMLQRLGPAASSKSWALTAQLVAVGQELGLHLDCVEWRIPAWEKGLRKRLAWALFMQDKWGALTHGRPSHITSANWAVRQISPSDFPEITRDDKNEEEVQELESGRILFIEMIKLTQVTGEILDGFFTVDANRVLDGKISRVLERAKPIQIKLRDWYVKLPEVLKMDSGGTSRVKKLSSNGYLHLAYFATEITLHRQILRTLSPPLTSPLPATIPDQNLLHICRSAAKSRLISAMDFVNRLKPEHLRSFWYFASKVNFALIGTFGSLLWATSPTVQEAEFYKARLAEYRWTLRVSAKGADFMEFAVGVLDVGIG
ncbi:fungal-specific transcription factor domain-containing protein, partial [Kalaharituber pfeilii]